MLNNDGVFAGLKVLLIFEAPKMNEFLLTTQNKNICAVSDGFGLY